MTVGLTAAALATALKWWSGGSEALVRWARETLSGPGAVCVGAIALGLVVAALLSVFSGLLAKPDRQVRESFRPIGASSRGETLREVRARLEARVDGGSEDVTALLDELLSGALELTASDLHIRPAREGILVTYRVDGALLDVCTLPPGYGPRLSTRIKVLGRLDPFARHPLDGKLRHRVGTQPLEARVSTLPTELGDRIVLRIVKSGSGLPDIAELGFTSKTTEQLKEILARPEGLLLVSGPVGSGKTTTLYSALDHIHASRGKTASLVTLEDPIEQHLAFATQTQINPDRGLSFAQALRSALRQDPNVLMLGEIRDRETAAIATQAGLTGHLILSTLHVDRAAGIFPRLMEMGVEPFVLASTLAGAMSQRLVRALCTHCRRPAGHDSVQAQRLAHLGVELLPGDYCEPAGCDFCEGNGFLGRIPIAELLVVTPDIRKLMTAPPTVDAIEQAALAGGMVPLLSDGLARAARGETSLSEVLRVTT
jgi:general secretion pathway protein E